MEGICIDKKFNEHSKEKLEKEKSKHNDRVNKALKEGIDNNRCILITEKCDFVLGTKYDAMTLIVKLLCYLIDNNHMTREDLGILIETTLKSLEE